MTKKDLNQQLQKVRKAGWNVRLTNGGHYQVKSPDGQLLHTGQTPSDYRGVANNAARLRRAGFDPNAVSDQRRKERVARAHRTRDVMSNTAIVLEILQKSIGAMSAGDIAAKCGLSETQVASSLNYLVRTNPNVARESRGRFVHDEPVFAPEESESESARVTKGKDMVTNAVVTNAVVTNNGNGTGKSRGSVGVGVLERPPDIDLTAVRVEPEPQEPIVVKVPETRSIVVKAAELPSDAPGLFEAVTVDRDHNLVLKDENGDLWLAVPLRPVLPKSN